MRLRIWIERLVSPPGQRGIPVAVDFRGQKPVGEGSLDVATAWGGDTAWVVVQGELDAFTASALRAELRAVEDAEPMLIVVDLRAVQFLDSSGLAVILGARERAVEAVAWDLELIIAGSSAVEEMFAAIHADSLFTIAVDPGPAPEEPRGAAVVSATQTG